MAQATTSIGRESTAGKYTALELNQSAVEFATKRGLDVQCSTFENAALSANSFDCMIMSQVLEHLYSPRLALLRCHELLRLGGLLLVTVPKFDSWAPSRNGELLARARIPRSPPPFQSARVRAHDQQRRI